MLPHTAKIRGFTLVELIVTLAVIAIIATLAAPSMKELFDRRRVVAAAEEVYSNIQRTRSEAITRNQIIHIKFVENNTTTWSYGISQNAGCNPNQTLADLGTGTPCVLVIDDGDGVIDGGDGATDASDVFLFSYLSTDHQDITLDMPDLPNLNKQISFDPSRGILDSADNTEILLTSDSGFQMKVIVNVVGHIRICSPAGTGHVPGYSSDGC